MKRVCGVCADWVPSVGGGLLFVPAGWVRVADVGVEALTSIYVSMGVTARQHLSRARMPEGTGDAR